MQAPEPAKRSPWALRLAIAGGVMVLLGVGLLSSQSGTIATTMDPREFHHGAYSGEGTFVTGSLNDTCYRFYQTGDDEPMTVNLYRVEGSALVGEPIEEEGCLLDFQAMTADNTNMVEVASWVLNASSDHALVITCEADCAESTGWLMSINAMQNELFGSTWLMLGISVCCLGIMTTPVALIVYYASKPSQAPKVMMVGGDGKLIPLTDLNPDHPTFFTQSPPEKVQPQVAPPFADTAEKQPAEGYVDGLPEVAAGTMLTTEQVYALMRGDVEGAQEHAKTQRSATGQAEDAVKEAASAARIASWDEGVPLADAPSTAPSPTTARRPSATTPSSEPMADAWKDWDEL